MILNATITNGFKSSIGWNLGKIPKSIHLLEPLTSIPINGTKNKKIKDIIKRNKQRFINLDLSKNERVKKINMLKMINIRCLKKK